MPPADEHAERLDEMIAPPGARRRAAALGRALAGRGRGDGRGLRLAGHPGGGGARGAGTGRGSQPAPRPGLAAVAAPTEPLGVRPAIRTTCARRSRRTSQRLHFSEEPLTAGLDEAMRYSLLRRGKRIRPVLALATALAVGPRPSRGDAARRRDRADPHILADPRRPARDGRRRAARGQPDLPRRVRRGRRDPRRRRRSTPRPSATSSPASAPIRARCCAAAADLAGATGVERDGRRAVSRRTADARRRPRGLRRLHALKTGRLIAACVLCVLLFTETEDAGT